MKKELFLLLPIVLVGAIIGIILLPDGINDLDIFFLVTYLFFAVIYYFLRKSRGSLIDSNSISIRKLKDKNINISYGDYVFDVKLAYDTKNYIDIPRYDSNNKKIGFLLRYKFQNYLDKNYDTLSIPDGMKVIELDEVKNNFKLDFCEERSTKHNKVYFGKVKVFDKKPISDGEGLDFYVRVWNSDNGIYNKWFQVSKKFYNNGESGTLYLTETDYDDSWVEFEKDNI